MIYQARKGQQGDLVLFKDGMQSICPFVQPITMQGNMGQVQLMRLPCTSLCPLSEVGEDHWSCFCGSEEVTVTLAKEPEEPESKIISL